MQRVNSFETLRGILTLCILVYHFLIIFYPDKVSYFKGAFLAVEVFFVLSGFLITKMLVNGKYDIISFLWRRFLRLYPTLIFVTTSSYLIVLYSGYDLFSYKLKELIYGFLSIYNYFLVFFEIPYFERYEKEMLFLPLWSLSMEIQFYILSAIITYLISNRKILTIFFLLLIFLFSSLSYIYFNQVNMNPNDIYFRSEARVSAFFIGGFLALYEENLRLILLKLNLILREIIFLITAVLIGLIFIYIDIYRDWFFPFGFLLVDCLSGVLILSLALKDRISSFLYNIGLISYPIFLWHYPVFIIAKYSFSNAFLPFVSLLLVFILSFSTHKFIEEPFRDLYKRNYFIKDELILKVVSALIVVITLSMFTVYRDRELLMMTKREDGVMTEGNVETNEIIQNETKLNVALVDLEKYDELLRDYYEERENELLLIKTEEPQEIERYPQNPQNKNTSTCKAFLLGDSVMLGAANKLTSNYKGIIIDARVNRSFIEGYNIVKKNINTIKDCENIVIHLGNNGYPRKGLLEQLIEFIKDNTNNNTNIFFVNLKASRLSWEHSFNTNLYNLQQANKIKVIDWYSTAKEDILYKDGIHLNNKGIVVYTKMIAEALSLNQNNEDIIKSKIVKNTKVN